MEMIHYKAVYGWVSDVWFMGKKLVGYVSISIDEDNVAGA